MTRFFLIFKSCVREKERVGKERENEREREREVGRGGEGEIIHKQMDK